MVRIRVFKEFAYDSALVQRLVVVFQSRDKASRIELQERFRLVVWIDFNVFYCISAKLGGDECTTLTVWNILLLQDCPSAANKRAAGPILTLHGTIKSAQANSQPPRIELQRLLR